MNDATPKRLKVPRASIACTILDDTEYMELAQTPAGREAFALFCALIAAAKAQANGGRFTGSDVVLALLVRWPVADFRAARDYLLAAPGAWLVAVEGGFEIRSFAKWNVGWGGPRLNSGRPPKSEIKLDSSGNQDARLGSTPATATATATKETARGRVAPAWALDLAQELADHVQTDRGVKTSSSDLAKWAAALDRLTRARALDPQPAPEEVAAVIRWGLQDRAERGDWRGWGAVLWSAPDAKKFANIRAAMKQGGGKGARRFESAASQAGKFSNLKILKSGADHGRTA